ncbi:MAG: lysostaphin resistance A-like protein [Candidatus Thorarchaeota archaeon]
MKSYSRTYSFLNFFIPALVSVGAIILLQTMQLIVLIPLSALVFNLSEFKDPLFVPIWNLLVLFLSQIMGTAIVLLLLIPWIRVKAIKHSPIYRSSFFSTTLVICSTWAFMSLIARIFLASIELFRFETPKTGLSILVLSEEIISPVTITILFAPLVLGAALYEELVYRRVLIPLLEVRGMNSFTAVIASSLFFTISHAPADLINGNITGTVIHLSSVLIMAFVLGFTYVKTRNIIYPMIIHGVINGITAVPTILPDGTLLADAYDFIYLVIFVLIGLMYTSYHLIGYLNNISVISSQIIDMISSINNIGFAGYLVISLGLLTLHTLSIIYFNGLAMVVLNPVLLITILFIIRTSNHLPEEFMVKGLNAASKE